MAGAANYPCGDDNLAPQDRASLADSGRQGASPTRKAYNALDFRSLPVGEENSPEWNGWSRTDEPEGSEDLMTLTQSGSGGTRAIAGNGG